MDVEAMRAFDDARGQFGGPKRFFYEAATFYPTGSCGVYRIRTCLKHWKLSRVRNRTKRFNFTVGDGSPGRFCGQRPAARASCIQN